MIVYKVVVKEDDRFYSSNKISLCMHNDPSIVEYKIGEKTKPPKNYGPLLAFKTVEAALNFAALLDVYILECEAVLSKKEVLNISFFISPKDIKSIWGGREVCRRLTSPPEDTVFCSSITPRKVLC